MRFTIFLVIAVIGAVVVVLLFDAGHSGTQSPAQVIESVQKQKGLFTSISTALNKEADTSFYAQFMPGYGLFYFYFSDSIGRSGSFKVSGALQERLSDLNDRLEVWQLSRDEGDNFYRLNTTKSAAVDYTILLLRSGEKDFHFDPASQLGLAPVLDHIDGPRMNREGIHPFLYRADKNIFLFFNRAN